MQRDHADPEDEPEAERGRVEQQQLFALLEGRGEAEEGYDDTAGAVDQAGCEDGHRRHALVPVVVRRRLALDEDAEL